MKGRRAIKDYPEKTQAQIRAAMGEDPGTTTFEKMGESLRLEDSDETKLLSFPNLVLLSVDQMIGSKKKDVQARAKHEARVAVAEWVVRQRTLRDSSRWTGEFDMTVIQRRLGGVGVDAPNLYTKHLIDLLLVRGGGIGIVFDDSPTFLGSVENVSILGAMRNRVEIVITPGSWMRKKRNT